MITQEHAFIAEIVMSMMGVDKMAYVKPIATQAEKLYVVFAADGTQLATFDCINEAFNTVRRHNLTPVNIH